MGKAEARELVMRIGKNRTLGLAAEMSFWLFLALVPLAFVAGLAAAKIAVGHGEATSAVLSTLPAVTRELVSSEVSKVASTQGGAVAPVGIFVFVWLASSGVHAVFDAMELEAGCGRPWWKKRLMAIGACILLSLGVALVALLGSGLDWLWRLTDARALEPAALALGSLPGRIVRFVLGALVAFGLTTGLFALGVPKAARRAMPLVPGALLTVAIEIVLGPVYGFYVSKAGTGSAYQAGLAAIGVTMTALYLFSVAILVGLELDVVLRDRQKQPECARDAVPHSA
jgi:membrane protein